MFRSDDQNSAEVSVRNQYLEVYGALGGFSALAIMISSLFVAVGGLNASSKLHNKMLVSWKDSEIHVDGQNIAIYVSCRLMFLLLRCPFSIQIPKAV